MAVFALADCNNFFVSCERVFRPDLAHRPVIVLSNNDGCVISRSEEAKALGIGMAAPFFQIKALVAEHRVVVISANHELYVDVSRRVVDVLRRHAPQVEEYSIDESFLTFPEGESPIPKARALRAEVLRWTGIPVSVGLARTKALAKLASDQAKKAGGVLSLLDDVNRVATLARTPVEHVWGIAKRSAEKLAAYGARTAEAFAALPEAVVMKELGIGGARLAAELRGEPRLAFAPAASRRQSILVSRSFGAPVWSQSGVETALASFAARAAERARRHGLRAGAVRVFVGWRGDGGAELDERATRLAPTNDTAALTRAAKTLADAMFVEGRGYRKAGIMLGALTPEENGQADLFADPAAERGRRLSSTVDRLNASLGSGTLRFGGEGSLGRSASKSESRSPRWTTCWEEIPSARAVP